MAEVKKPRAQITISRIIDIESVTRYYKLQSASAAAPSKPTDGAAIPSGWTKTEPAYQNGATNRLYFVDQTIMTNGGIYYSQVSLSSSYEAAKEAWNKANNAQKTADGIADNIYYPDTVEIDGNKLRAGTVTAKQINVDDLFAQNINATGSISGMTINAKKGQIGTWDISSEGLSRGFGIERRIDDLMNTWVGRYYELRIGSDQTPEQKDASFFAVSASDEAVVGSGARNPVLARHVINLLGEQYTYGEYDSVEKNGATINYPKTHISNTAKGISAYKNTVDDSGNVQSEEKVNINAECSKFSGITNNGTIDSTGDISTSGNLYRKGNRIGETFRDAGAKKTIKNATWTNTGAYLKLPAGVYVLMGTIAFGASKGGRLAARFADSTQGYDVTAQVQPGMPSSMTAWVQCQWIVSITEETTYHLQAFQQTGADLAVMGTIKAVRIA